MSVVTWRRWCGDSVFDRAREGLASPSKTCQHGLLGTTGMHRPPIPSDARLVEAGRGMRRIRTSKPDVTWLQGPGPTDLWTWLDGSGAIMAQELTFFGRTIVEKNGVLMTGLCDDGGGAPYLGKTGLLDFDAQLDREALAAASLVLSAIPEAARGASVAHLEDAVRAAIVSLAD